METAPAEQDQDLNDTSTEKVVTELVNGRLVAHVYGHEEAIDSFSAVAQKAREATAKWDEHKPNLRSMARRVIESIQSKGIQIRAVLFAGAQEKPIEVCPSDKRKPLSDDLINETKFSNAEYLMEETTEVILTGSLARWAITNLPIMAKPDILKDNFYTSKKTYLTEAFRDLYKKVMVDEEASVDVKAFYRRLLEGGFNAPAVEAKK